MNDISTKTFYTSPVISVKLDISESTLRKYCQILERSGWIFSKNERNARVFSDVDLDVLELFIKIKEELGMSLEKSSDMAVRYYQQGVSTIQDASASSDNTLIEKQQDNVVQEVRHAREYFEGFFKKELEKQSEKFYEGYDILIEKINETIDENAGLKKENRELKNTVSEVKDILIDVREDQKKSFFSRLFGS